MSKFNWRKCLVGALVSYLLKSLGVLLLQAFPSWWDGVTSLITIEILSWGPVLFFLSMALHYWIQEKRITKFDMPIAGATRYIVSTGAFISYTPQSRRQMEAFKAIHEFARDDEIGIAGVGINRSVPKRIPPNRLWDLKPSEVVVPISASAPEGIVFGLCSASPDTTHEHSGGMYTELRVRSKDIYGKWPKLIPVEVAPAIHGDCE